VLNLDIELNVLAIILLLPSLLNKICRLGPITEAPVLFLLKEPPAFAKITMQSEQWQFCFHVHKIKMNSCWDFSPHIAYITNTYTLREKRYKSCHCGCTFSIGKLLSILGANMSISGANMYILICTV